MNKLVLTLLASTALAVPALAAPNNPAPQQPQAQSQTQQPKNQNPDANTTPQTQAQNQPSAQQPSPNANHSAQGEQPSEQSNRQAANQIVRPSQLSHSKIRKLQQALNKKGFRSGHVDGIWGPQTRDAVRTFQRSKGMHTAQLTKKTLSDLGIQVASNESSQSSMNAPGGGK